MEFSSLSLCSETVSGLCASDITTDPPKLVRCADGVFIHIFIQFLAHARIRVSSRPNSEFSTHLVSVKAAKYQMRHVFNLGTNIEMSADSNFGHAPN